MSDTNINSVQSIISDLSRHLTDTGLVKQTSKQLSSSDTNHERVDLIYALLDGAGLLPALLEDRKCNGLAETLRQKGNEMFKLRKDREALENYTKSIASAEEFSEHLALAYANRSAVLFEKGLFEECLRDIDRALENNYPIKLKSKIIARQEKAKTLKTDQIRTSHFQPIPQIPEDQKNELIDCASDALKIKYEDGIGRHVVATRDISIGEVVAVEKPFCHILIERIYDHCHECLKLCYNLIPCWNCTQAMFCSQECKNRNADYHRYECPILKTTRELGMDKLSILPMKIAIMAKDVYSDINSDYTLDDSGVYRSDRYKEIHNLVSNTELRHVSDIYKRSVSAAIIFHLVKKYTSFFRLSNEDIFKDLVLLHLQTAPCNFHEISELAENDHSHIYDLTEIGAGAYSFLSMFNHSCDPNIVRHCYGPAIVLRAIRSIKKGQQCYDNYGYHYAVMDKDLRETNLKSQYFFKCECEACMKNWPLFEDMPLIHKDIAIWVDYKKGDVDVAKGVLDEVLPRISEFENHLPNRGFAEMQEVVKQCFALLGNVRKTL
ncbi:hypothetical protein NQ317_006485 [Molorchus minor]|uniref:Protein-lysine N-methyltransferase SMYD4 n=1 Tax=Molorchus minor TaxID=1323400 RepID=A0ABQ9J8Q5_9CUCU|nr:hypothetical protein NQ317_006485 [Molorchus minor]